MHHIESQRARGPGETLSLDAFSLADFPEIGSGRRIPDEIDSWLGTLARAAQLGDRAARNRIFELLYPRFAPMMGRIRAADLWRDREGRSWTFDDLEQESFLIVCDLIASWKGEGGFAGYIFSRLPWRLRDLLRRWTAPAKREAVALPLGLPAEEWIDLVEVRTALEAVFARLPGDAALVLRLRAIDGLRDEAIAVRLGVHPRTIRRRRQLAYRQARMIYLGEERGEGS